MTSATVWAVPIASRSYMGQLAVMCRHPDCAQEGEPAHLITVVINNGYGARGAIAQHLATHAEQASA